jgi:hypothetical protein
MKVVRLSDLRTGRLYPQGNTPGTHFCHKLSRPQCPCGRKESRRKIPVTTSGFKTATFWLVAQCLNQQYHRVPPTCYKIRQNYFSIFGWLTESSWLTDMFGPNLSVESSLNHVNIQFTNESPARTARTDNILTLQSETELVNTVISDQEQCVKPHNSLR